MVAKNGQLREKGPRAKRRTTARKVNPLVAAVDRVLDYCGLDYFEFGELADEAFRVKAAAAYQQLADFLCSTGLGPDIISLPLPKADAVDTMWMLSFVRAAAPLVDLGDPSSAQAFMLGVALTAWPNRLNFSASDIGGGLQSERHRLRGQLAREKEKKSRNPSNV